VARAFERRQRATLRLTDEIPAIKHSEIMAALSQGKYVKAVIIESAKDEAGRQTYVCQLLLSWTQRYHALALRHPVQEPDEPRQFRDLDRLINLIRHEYGYLDTIALRIAGRSEGTKKTRLQRGKHFRST
jgi:hypothetical protein